MKIIEGNKFIPPEEKKQQPKKTPQDIADIAVEGLVKYAKTWLNVETDEGQQQSMELKHVMDRMAFAHQREHRPDLTKGDFECKVCGTPGARPTVPAFPYSVVPHHLIIPVRNEEDAAVVEALKQGKTPTPPKSAQPNPKKKGRSPAKDKVRHGRIVKQRVNEKQTVLSRMREEDLMESVGGINLLD